MSEALGMVVLQTYGRGANQCQQTWSKRHQHNVQVWSAYTVTAAVQASRKRVTGGILAKSAMLKEDEE